MKTTLRRMKARRSVEKKKTAFRVKVVFEVVG